MEFGAYVYASEGATSSTDCEKELKQKLLELIENDHKGILSKQFELTTLKLAIETSKSNSITLEHYIKKQADEIKKMDSEKVLESVSELYKENGFAKDENHFIKEFESLKTNYNLVLGNGKTLNKVSTSRKNGFIQKTFMLSNNSTNEAITLLYDKVNYQFFVFQGSHIKNQRIEKSKQENEYIIFIKEYNELLSGIHSLSVVAYDK